ncbi:MAG: DUF523 domain-containing protein [Roseburia sp.]|nr:DUF523 domain-containing protein [Anaeroplasma bactoclasticum]MCM1196598.1 DUF523 domain-containing protein [Roseburia sp.]MCM1556032.1 DUF523 domain-containing protein [Anaeroplasma bactoclasticum]
MMKTKLLISACLCGKNTKYNGGNNLLSKLSELEEKFELYLICPEVMGGLTTPRDPSENRGNLVFSDKGKDVTEEFNLGAQKALAIALKNDIHLALLKEFSPSCGSHKIYDGTFSGIKIFGQGVAAKLLQEHNIKIFSEEQVNQLLEE